jgi:citrate synthase
VSEYRTGIGTSTDTSISLLGHDITELIGNVSFGELAFWLAAKRRPNAHEVRLFEAVLLSLADHGFTPTAIAARLTFYSAPDALQGAIAAGLLGGGSRFLGVTEDTGRFLNAAIVKLENTSSWTDAQWNIAARALLEEAARNKVRVPGLGHPVHKAGDPRTPVMFALARQERLFGPHLSLFEAIGRTHQAILGKKLPLNGAGVAGAALADLGLPIAFLRGFALLARTAGLIGHLVEEQQSPIGPAVYTEVDRNAVYEPSKD